MRKALELQLGTVEDVDVSPSMFRTEDAWWVNGHEVAHFHDDRLEIRLTRAVIRQHRSALKANPRVHLRTDWIDIEYTDPDVLPWFRLAVAAHRPPAGQLPQPPPTGAALERRRRFH